MDEKAWLSWNVQTARDWDDLHGTIRLTGVDPVDRDHIRLVEFALEVNRVLSRMGSGRLDLDLVQDGEHVLTEFQNFAAHHFAREEEIIDKYCLPGASKHREQHAEILRMMTKTVADFFSGKVGITAKLKLYILEWVVNHINEVDYVTFRSQNYRSVIEQSMRWEQLRALIRRTGIPSIDTEHRHVVQGALEIIEIIEREKGVGRSVAAAFSGYREMVLSHFRNEAQLISSFGLKGGKEQGHQHSDFLHLLEESERNAGSSGCDPLSVKRNLMEWWIEHINVLDFSTFNLPLVMGQVLRTSDSRSLLSGLIFRTGIDSVDKEHRIVVEHVVEISRSFFGIDGSIDRSGFLAELKKLMTLIEAHFENENRIMRERRIQNHEDHIKEHERMLEKIRELIEQSVSDGHLRVAHFKTRLLDWWLHHTNSLDVQTFIDNGIDY